MINPERIIEIKQELENAKLIMDEKPATTYSIISSYGKSLILSNPAYPIEERMLYKKTVTIEEILDIVSANPMFNPPTKPKEK